MKHMSQSIIYSGLLWLKGAFINAISKIVGIGKSAEHRQKGLLLRWFNQENKCFKC